MVVLLSINNLQNSEIKFYNDAYIDNSSRIARGYGWDYLPSKVVIELVKRNKLDKSIIGKSFLDVGCGDGRHLNYFSNLGYSCTGVDFSSEAIKYCRKRFKSNISLSKLDATKDVLLNKIGKFDLILDWSVLDHIRSKHVSRYIKNLYDAVNNNGKIIFVEFAPTSNFLNTGKRKYTLTSGHYSRVYSFEELSKVVYPFKVIDYCIDICEDKANDIKMNAIICIKT